MVSIAQVHADYLGDASMALPATCNVHPDAAPKCNGEGQGSTSTMARPEALSIFSPRSNALSEVGRELKATVSAYSFVLLFRAVHAGAAILCLSLSLST